MVSRRVSPHPLNKALGVNSYNHEATKISKNIKKEKVQKREGNRLLRR